MSATTYGFVARADVTPSASVELYDRAGVEAGNSSKDHHQHLCDIICNECGWVRYDESVNLWGQEQYNYTPVVLPDGSTGYLYCTWDGLFLLDAAEAYELPEQYLEAYRLKDGVLSFTASWGEQRSACERDGRYVRGFSETVVPAGRRDDLPPLLKAVAERILARLPLRGKEVETIRATEAVAVPVDIFPPEKDR